MIELGPVTEQEMVLAFLRAEIDSVRFGPIYANILKHNSLNRSTLIDGANLNDAQQNLVRAAVLQAVRGFKANKLLFRGFPADATWRRVRLNVTDYGTLKYANYPTWIDISGKTRKVSDGARNIDLVAAAEDANRNIKAVAEAIMNGKRYPELIAVDGHNGELILLEGHTRATAYVLAKVEPTDIIVASSSRLNEWAFF